MDVRYINPFLTAVSRVFTTMVGAPVVTGRPYLKQTDDDAADVIAFIGISGDVCGTVSFCLPEMTALRVARSFAHTEMPVDDPQFADALGEVVNMIAGQAKAQFEGRDCTISLPRVIRGTDVQTLDSDRNPVLVLPCDSVLGRFRLEITMRAARPGRAAAEAFDNAHGVSQFNGR